MAVGFGVEAPKGRTRKQADAAAARREADIKKAVRAECVARDGHCRIGRDEGFESCAGPSEWSHWGRYKRFKTRNMRPEIRHNLVGSLMLCRQHHRLYDAGRLTIRALTEAGCDGTLVYTVKP